MRLNGLAALVAFLLGANACCSRQQPPRYFALTLYVTGIEWNVH